MVRDFFNGQPYGVVAKIREGVLNPDAPANTTSSILKYGEAVDSASNFTLILPHSLLDKTRFK